MAPPIKRTSRSSINRNGSPRKRIRGVIGAITDADSTARLIAAAAEQEHGNGRASLSTRNDPSSKFNVKTLISFAVRAGAEGILGVVKLNPKPSSREYDNLVGWDQNNRDRENSKEIFELRDFIKTLPEVLANNLLESVLRLSNQHARNSNSLTGVGSQDSGDDGSISVLALATLFLHSNTTKLSLSSLSAPALFLSKIPNCTRLRYLDLSSHTQITDVALAKILALLPTLEVVVLRGATKVGDLSCIALSKASESRLKSVNLSLCAVTIRGLVSILSRCCSIEVLKLANVPSLNEKAITRLVDESTAAALGWRHIPLSNLKTLKLRSTEITDSSLGRLLALCSLSLTSLDISYTNIKSLDILSQALFTRTSPWRLTKLVASGLPLSPTTLRNFLEPLSLLPSNERNLFQTLKLGTMTASSAKHAGLTDLVLKEILPSLERLEGLQHISFYQNWNLGKSFEPLSRFIEVVGRRCKSLDLTIPLESYHLDGFFPPLPTEEDEEEGIDAFGGGGEGFESPKLEVLILNGSKITDLAAAAIGQCKGLRSLHIAETKISTAGLASIMRNCPLLSTINLTSCRGIPLAQRRNWFDAWEKGEVQFE